MAKKLVRCEYCDKKDFWSPTIKQYIIWKYAPLKNNDGSYMTNELGEVQLDAVKSYGAKPTLPEAIVEAEKTVIPFLGEHETVEYERVELAKEKHCPECKATIKKYYDRAFATRKKQIKEGIKVLDQTDLVKEMFDDVNRKINQDYANKMKAEEETRKRLLGIDQQ